VDNRFRPAFRSNSMDDPRDLALPPRRTTPSLQHSSSNPHRGSGINNVGNTYYDQRGARHPSSGSLPSRPNLPSASNTPDPRFLQVPTPHFHDRRPDNMSGSGGNRFPDQRSNNHQLNLEHNADQSDWRMSIINSNVGDSLRTPAAQPNEPYVNYRDPRWRKQNPEAASEMERNGVVPIDNVRGTQLLTIPQRYVSNIISGLLCYVCI